MYLIEFRFTGYVIRDALVGTRMFFSSSCIHCGTIIQIKTLERHKVTLVVFSLFQMSCCSSSRRRRLLHEEPDSFLFYFFPIQMFCSFFTVHVFIGCVYPLVRIHFTISHIRNAMITNTRPSFHSHRAHLLETAKSVEAEPLIYSTSVCCLHSSVQCPLSPLF